MRSIPRCAEPTEIYRAPAETAFVTQRDHQIAEEVHEAVTNFVLVPAPRDRGSEVVEVVLNHPGPAGGGCGQLNSSGLNQPAPG